MRALIQGIVAGAVLVVMAVAAAPSAAAPSWSQPETLSPRPGAHPPVAVMDARGNALVVWSYHEGDGSVGWGNVRYSSSYRWWVPGRGWSKVRDLPRAAGEIIDLAITPRGEAVVLVTGTGAERVPLAVGIAKPGGAVEDLETITDSAYGGGHHALGIDDAGNAIVAWTPLDRDRMLVSSRRAGARFDAAQGVGRPAGGHPDVAVNPAGAAAVLWIAPYGHPRLAYRPPGGAFGSEEDPGLRAGGIPLLGMDQDGAALVASNSFDGSPGAFGPGSTRAEYAIRSSLGDWSGIQPIDDAGGLASMVVGPRGAITFTVTGRAPEDRNFFLTRYPDGRTEREPIGTSDARVAQITTPMNLRGDVLAVWVRLPETFRGTIIARERTGGASRFGPEMALGGADASGPTAAVNDLGQAIAAWNERSDVGGRLAPRVVAAVRDDPALHDAPPPPDVDLYGDPLAALDGDGDLRAPIRCDVSCKVKLTGLVFPGGAQKPVAGNGKSVRVKAKRRTRVKLDFGAAGAQAVREALAAGLRPWASVSVSARGRSPRPLTVSRRYKLRR